MKLFSVGQSSADRRQSRFTANIPFNIADEAGRSSVIYGAYAEPNKTLRQIRASNPIGIIWRYDHRPGTTNTSEYISALDGESGVFGSFDGVGRGSPQVISGTPQQERREKQQASKEPNEKPFVGAHNAYKPVKAGYATNNFVGGLVVLFFVGAPFLAVLIGRSGIWLYGIWGLCLLAVIVAMGGVK